MRKKVFVLGGILLVIGIFGFIPNSVVGNDSYFEAGTIHSLVHAIAGALLIMIGLFQFGTQKRVLKFLTIFYLVIAVLGFIAGEGTVLGFIDVNTADNWLHLIVSAVIFWSLRKNADVITAPSL